MGALSKDFMRFEREREPNTVRSDWFSCGTTGLCCVCCPSRPMETRSWTIDWLAPGKASNGRRDR
jgi:hypothetical protein